MNIIFFLIFIFIPKIGNASTHTNFLQQCEQNNNYRKNLESRFNTIGCIQIIEKLRSLKSFSQIYFANKKISLKRKILSAPWTDDFEHMYGLSRKVLSDQNLINPLETYNLEKEQFFEPFLYSEFTNLKDIPLLPEYFFSKTINQSCETLKKLTFIESATVPADSLKSKHFQKCLSRLKKGIIIRDEFKGDISIIKDLRVVGIEYYSGNIKNLTKFKELKYLGIAKKSGSLDKIELIYTQNRISHLSLNIQPGVTSLDKISYLRGLEYLNLKCSEDEALNEYSKKNCEKMGITDISFLKEIPFLRHLNLSNNNILDFKPLGELSDLEYLNLQNNKIKTIPKLNKLKRLKFLDLSHNEIEDISKLEEMNNLVLLKLNSNKISNIETIYQLKKLRFLNLSKNRKLTIKKSNLQSESLAVLNLNGDNSDFILGTTKNEFFNINVFKNEKELIFETLFSDLLTTKKTTSPCHEQPVLEANTILAQFPNLEILTIKNRGLREIPKIDILKSLKYLDLEGNQINSLDTLGSSETLNYLDLTNNILLDFPDLSKYSGLSTIKLGQNLINNLSNFSKKPQRLSQIDLTSNIITDIEFIIRTHSNLSNTPLRIELYFNYIPLTECDRYPHKLTEGCNTINNPLRRTMGEQFVISEENIPSLQNWRLKNRCEI